MQGDVIGLCNSNGVKICDYTYNAWGVCEVSFTGSNTTELERRIGSRYNPFRYRGYYYDIETGLYYLQSRYYNPEWGRFLNADGYISTGTGMLGYNMFVYCNNSPVMLVDPTGDFPWIILAVVAVALVVFSSCGSDTPNTKSISVDPGYFDSVDDAVSNFRDEYFFDSFNDDKEYATVIYEEQYKGKTVYSYSIVRIGTANSVPPYFASDKKMLRLSTHMVIYPMIILTTIFLILIKD